MTRKINTIKSINKKKKLSRKKKVTIVVIAVFIFLAIFLLILNSFQSAGYKTESTIYIQGINASEVNESLDTTNEDQEDDDGGFLGFDWWLWIILAIVWSILPRGRD